MAQRHVAGPSGRCGEREADDIGAHRVEPVRLGIHGHYPGLGRLGDPRVQRGQRGHALIGSEAARGLDSRLREQIALVRPAGIGLHRRRRGAIEAKAAKKFVEFIQSQKFY